MTPQTYAKLVEELETLREENRQLRDLLVPPAVLPASWKLTPLESRVVLALSRSNDTPLRAEHLLEIVYGAGHDRDVGSIDVAICKIRRKRDLHGLEIVTSWGHGFVMPAESCAAVRAHVSPAARRMVRIEATTPTTAAAA